MSGAYSYDAIGVTALTHEAWPPSPAAYRRYEHRERIGARDQWVAMNHALLRWEIKARSGFVVDGPALVAMGAQYVLRAKITGGLVSEPIVIVDLVQSANRVGFAYGTLDGHPVRGEEAFILERRPDGVWLTLRSVSKPGPGLWRAAWPALRFLQGVYRRRYFKALSSTVVSN